MKPGFSWWSVISNDPGLNERLLVHDRFGLFATVGEEEDRAARTVRHRTGEDEPALVLQLPHVTAMWAERGIFLWRQLSPNGGRQCIQ